LFKSQPGDSRAEWGKLSIEVRGSLKLQTCRVPSPGAAAPLSASPVLGSPPLARRMAPNPPRRVLLDPENRKGAARAPFVLSLTVRSAAQQSPLAPWVQPLIL